VHGVKHESPLFAFSFHGGLGQSLQDLAEVDAAAGNADFIWVHLDLDDTAAQAWLRRRPWSPEIIDMVAAPIQRGRLFVRPDLVYGHLRDFRDEPNAVSLRAGSLCIAASRMLVVTGRRIPLLSVEEVRRRVEARLVLPASPFDVITEFFRALNDIGESRLQETTERLGLMESQVLKRNAPVNRKEILEMRGDAIRVARDMAYKRTAMIELTREPPAIFSVEEFNRFNHQIHRYAALVEDAEEYADNCQFLLEELRSQVEHETNRNLYVLTMVSVIFLPGTLIASIWGMNVGGIPFGGSPNGFSIVAALIAAVFALVGIFLFRLRPF
jgi:zinc transporter